MSEQEFVALEAQFPMLSGEAFASARQRVLASGQSVLQIEGEMMVRLFPDGKKESLKQIAPSISATPGTVYVIR